VVWQVQNYIKHFGISGSRMARKLKTKVRYKVKLVFKTSTGRHSEVKPYQSLNGYSMTIHPESTKP